MCLYCLDDTSKFLLTEVRTVSACAIKTLLWLSKLQLYLTRKQQSYHGDKQVSEGQHDNEDDNRQKTRQASARSETLRFDLNGATIKLSSEVNSNIYSSQ